MSQYPPPGQYDPPPGGQYGQQYPPPPPGNYQPPPGGQQYWQESPKGKGLAITALVLGIIAVLSCWTVVGGILFGLLAAIFGLIAMVKARGGSGGGLGLAVTGLVLGLLGLIASIVFVIVGYSWFVDNGGKNYLDCITDANGDQSKVDQCERDFKSTIEDKYSITLTPAPTN
ncbi:DUF4190 domain-containing protein [Nocardia jejuensis]|uniref:DUF4190 domain-containing protein n=1 Tax=Nocardia jejuensis TaxID=328049 RepID=UPI0008362AA3|nr:DUF4190 domain-containing protein [Nocardia jejuensis]